MLSMAERGISIPTNEISFKKPENNIGSVATLEKPREVAETISTNNIEDPQPTREPSYKKILNKTKFVGGWPSSMRVKETRYTDYGAQIYTTPEVSNIVKRRVAGRSARHEIKHAIINPDNVEKVTIIPGDGYLGLTELIKPDPIAALAPHATGENGTGHDVFVASLMVDNINSVGNVAKNIVQNNTEEIEEAASVLEEKKTITSYDLKQAIFNVRNRKNEGEKATVIIKNPDGSEEQIPHVKVKDGIVPLPGTIEIPGNDHKLSTEGIIFSRN